MKALYQADVLIIGAGIIGLTIAWTLKQRFPGMKILMVDKAPCVGMHASGRNSGILHAGFYYTEDSLKARFTVEGNQKMQDFCRAENIPVMPTQKLVVAQSAKEVDVLHELHRRGLANGVDVSLISQAKAEARCPLVKTHSEALFSPNTASVDPKAVCARLFQKLQEMGVRFLFSEAMEHIGVKLAESKRARYQFDFLVNAAGLYADKLAHQVGIGHQYTMLPFKGMYYKFMGDPSFLSINIYPVPNLENPFLGVHWTKTADGSIKLGPTAKPAFWRENYGGLSGFKAGEFSHTVWHQCQLMRRPEFRRLAWDELRKGQAQIQSLGMRMLKHLPGTLQPMPPGIRAQLYDKKSRTLVMDFLVEKSRHAVHVLNAVSPGFTCSFSFAEYIVDEMMT